MDSHHSTLEGSHDEHDFCRKMTHLELGGVLDQNVLSLMKAVERGDASAAQPLFATLYAELRRLAKWELARHQGVITISPTTLLHEAYLSMRGKNDQDFPDRARFMGYAARAMRTFIIDHARERRAQKRGGLFEITSFDTEASLQSVDYQEVSQIGTALESLAKIDPDLAEIVDLKFFCGFNFAEIGALRNVSERTVQRNWERARLYLHDQIRTDVSL